MQLGVRRIGPDRPAAHAAPAKGQGWLHHYALVHDPERGGLLYVQEPDHHQIGPSWLLRDDAWTQVVTETMRIESPAQGWTGYFDRDLGHVVVWNWMEGRRPRPVGVVIDPAGLRRLETTGDPPLAAKEGFRDLVGLFAYDPVRRVLVCTSRRGVWELGADRAWRRVWGGGLFPDWGDHGGSAAYDAPRGRIVFQADVTDDRLRMVAWNGQAPLAVPDAGLPVDGYEVDFGDRAPVLGPHPELGAVIHLGGELGRYALEYTGKRWRKLKAVDAMPPRGGNYQIAFDPEHDAFAIGPGRYEPEPGEYPQDQQVFFVEGPLGWTRYGQVVRESPLEKLWSQKRFVASGGRWLALGSRTLHTYAWGADGWTELIGKDTGEEAWKQIGANLEVIAAGDGVLAVAMNGTVLELAGTSWRVAHQGTGELGAERIDAYAVWDPKRKRIVLWGGTVGGRFSNRTWFFENGAWRAARRASPRPAELAQESSPDYGLVYDTRLDRVVRLGERTVAVLEDELWVETTPKGYVPGGEEDAELDGLFGDDDGEDDGAEEDEEEDDGEDDEEDEENAESEDAAYPGSPRWCARGHDATTGITLVVSWLTGKVFRVDLGRCEPVGTIELPADLVVDREDEKRGVFQNSWCYDAGSRQIRVQNLDDEHGHYALDLGPLFDRCSAERAAPWESTLAAVHPWLCLYRPVDRMRWRGRVDGARLEIGEGPLESNEVHTSTHDDAGAAEAELAERLATARSEGYVPVAELDRPAVERMMTKVSRGIRIAKRPASGAPGPARLGGAPGGVPSELWPIYDSNLFDAIVHHLPEIYPLAALPQEARDEMLTTMAADVGIEPAPAPMGFLFQLPVPGFLELSAGIAVFVATSGRATEHNAYNYARFLSEQDLAAPGTPAPAGVATLPVFAMELGPEDRELDKNLVDALGLIDPGLVDRVEEVWAKDEDEDEDDDDDDDDDDSDDDDDNDDDSESGWHGKLGGDPEWVQSPERFQSRDGRPYRFLLQLDFDNIHGRVDDWPDAGLHGVLYVFVHPDEACAAAFWQYT